MPLSVSTQPLSVLSVFSVYLPVCLVIVKHHAGCGPKPKILTQAHIHSTHTHTPHTHTYTHMHARTRMHAHVQVTYSALPLTLLNISVTSLLVRLSSMMLVFCAIFWRPDKSMAGLLFCPIKLPAKYWKIFIIITEING